MGDSTTKVSGVDEDQLPLPENSTAMANPQQTDQMDVDSRSDSTPPQTSTAIFSDSMILSIRKSQRSLEPICHGYATF
jgi:hypothetical protein